MVPTASPKQIIRSVCKKFDLSEEQLRKKSNQLCIAFPRQLAAYLLRNDGSRYIHFIGNKKLSLPEIGQLLKPPGEKAKHHTTILHGINKIEQFLEDLENGPKLAAVIEQIRAGYDEPPSENEGKLAIKRGLGVLFQSRK